MSPDDEIVVLLHGLCCHSSFMVPLSLRLRRQGFRTMSWAYPSVRRSVAENARRLHSDLKARLGDYRRVHFVGHSMGTIVIRAALAESPLDNLGNTVMLTPPNQGAPVASHLCRLTRGWVRPFRELADMPTSYVKDLPAWCGGQVGIIAARGDLLVSCAHTRLPNATDYAEVPGMHTYVLVSKPAADLTAKFLREGHF